MRKYKAINIKTGKEDYFVANHKKEAVNKACFLMRTVKENIKIEQLKKKTN